MDDVKLIADVENIDVFTISETWLNSNISDDEVSIYYFVEIELY